MMHELHIFIGMKTAQVGPCDCIQSKWGNTVKILGSLETWVQEE